MVQRPRETPEGMREQFEELLGARIQVRRQPPGGGGDSRTVVLSRIVDPGASELSEKEEEIVKQVSTTHDIQWLLSVRKQIVDGLTFLMKKGFGTSMTLKYFLVEIAYLHTDSITTKLVFDHYGNPCLDTCTQEIIKHEEKSLRKLSASAVGENCARLLLDLHTDDTSYQESVAAIVSASRMKVVAVLPSASVPSKDTLAISRDAEVVDMHAVSQRIVLAVQERLDHLGYIDPKQKG